MSDLHPKEHWIDRYWQIFLILFGLLFVTMLMSLN
jgi:hypothetical protein